MPRLVPLVALLVLATLATELRAAPASSARPLDSQIDARARALRPKLVELRRDFHRHPELSNREERTGRVIAERLRALGLEVRTNVARHGVVASIRGGKPGPVIALRADMDALPIEDQLKTDYRSTVRGVKHACGHDAHMAILLGVAEVLTALRAELPGTVKLIFQPAEESPPVGEEGGAPLMIKEGALDNPRPQAIFGLHVMPGIPVGEVSLVPGAFMASVERLQIDVHGKASHGAQPQEGIDAVVAAAAIVSELQTVRSRRTDPLDPIVVSIGQIHGGNRYNILADEVMLEGTIRTLDEKTRTRVGGLIKQLAEATAAAHGATATVTIRENARVTFNDPALVPSVEQSLQRVLGKEHVVRGRPQLVGEDFSYYQQVIPGVFFHLGVGNRDKGITALNHTAAFDIDEEGLVLGVRTLATVALDALAQRAR